MVISCKNEKLEEMKKKLNMEQYDLQNKNITIHELEQYCMEELKKSPREEELEFMLQFADRFNLITLKAEVLKNKGDLNYLNENYDNAIFYYIDVLDLYSNSSHRENLGYVYNKLGLCKSNKLEYLEALSYFNKAYFYSALYKDEDIFKKSIYNLGRTYKKLNKYDEALYHIEEYIKLCNMNDEFINFVYARMLIANCYEKKNEIAKSIDIYMELAFFCKDKDDRLLGYIYNNLGALYLDMEKLEEASKYFDTAEEIREKIDPDNLPYIYINKAKIYIKQGEYDEALEMIHKGMRKLKEGNDDEFAIESYYMLIDIYTITKDIKSLKKIYSFLIEKLKIKKMDIDLIKVYSKLAEISLDEKDIKMCRKYMKMIEKI